MIQVSKPQLDNSELEYIQKVFQEGWLGHGKYVNEFEEKLKFYLQADNVLAVASGTAALHLALESCGIGAGDEVIVPSLTFVASVQAIIATGATPVFCEVYPHNLNMDVDDVKSKISENTRAIMPVHYCGISCEMDEIISIAQNYDLRIIEDAAHAFGSEYKGRKIGSIGDITCFSFDPIKNLTCGEGGAICSSDDSVIKKIKLKRMLGIDKDSWNRFNDVSYAYKVLTKGYRYHMSNINAAIGLAQLTKFEQFEIKRKEIARKYNEAFGELDNVEILDWNLDMTCPFTYVLKITNGTRDLLYEYLGQHGISCAINYIPNHHHLLFENEYELPITDKLFQQIISLPLHIGITENDTSRIISLIRNFFANN